MVGNAALAIRRGVVWVLANQDEYRAHVWEGAQHRPGEPLNEYVVRASAWIVSVRQAHARLRRRLEEDVKEEPSFVLMLAFLDELDQPS
jgi:hypothetical protein